jgi:hypothetical protein
MRARIAASSIETADSVAPSARCVRVQGGQALQVAGRNHVHRRSQRRDARPRPIVSALQVIRHRAVGIVGEQHLADGRTEAPRPDAGGRIAEVAARDDERGRHAVARGALPARRHVVRRLRQQAPEIDAVRRTEFEARAQRRIDEGLLDHALAVIEGAAHRAAVHVVVPAGELPLLRR